MPESLPHVPIDQIPEASSTNLSDSSNTFPSLEQILVTDSVGPQAANRQPKALEIRTETLREEINVLIDVMNALSLNFLHRDGTSKQSQGLPDPSYMRGNLDMQDPTGPTRYQVKNVANASQDNDAVNKAQLDALQADVDALDSSLGTDYVLRNGSLAMTGNLNMGSFQVENLASAINPADAVRKSDFDAALSTLSFEYVARDGSLPMVGDLNMSGNKITGLPTTGYPSLDGDAVPKIYVDQALASIAATPSGTVTAYAGATTPIGWVVCDGRSLSTTVFPDLFNAIGYTYGGSGTTFNVPDLRGRTLIGMDDFGSAAGPANRVTNPAADTLGGTLGAETHQLILNELPAHTHLINDNYFATGTGGAFFGENTPVTDADTLYTQTTATTSVGSNQAHNNMQPSMAMRMHIKT